ncbi:hypothetical protein CRG98_001887 [Punica granatum]|uniref:Uncharacterized protein n=1 Tax=Punica granatum TaxID=22663 RepID=A0A2I0LAP3_PUNGR|nr:hypothetical protein CRG98_001887 [Punica granatum]
MLTPKDVTVCSVRCWMAQSEPGGPVSLHIWMTQSGPGGPVSMYVCAARHWTVPVGLGGPATHYTDLAHYIGPNFGPARDVPLPVPFLLLFFPMPNPSRFLLLSQSPASIPDSSASRAAASRSS